MNAARALLLAMTAALVATALPAVADEGRLTASSLEYGSPATQSGTLALLYAAAAPEGEADGPAQAARPWIDLEAATLSAVEYEDTYAVASVPAGPMPLDLQAPGDPEASPSSYSTARAHLTEFQPDFQVHVYTLDGAIAYTARTAGGAIGSEDVARMGPGQYGDGSTGSPPSETAPPVTFAYVERAGPWIAQTATGAGFSVALEGDFVVELFGVTLEVEGDGEEGMLRSGTWEAPVDPNAPPQSQEAAHMETKRFVRMELTGAVLEFATDGGPSDIAWASGAATAEFSGPVTVLDATGRLDTANGPADLLHARHVLPPQSQVQLGSQEGQRLLVEVSPAPLRPQVATLSEVPAPASAALIGTGAVLALAIAIGIGVLRRVLRLPALADVEKAIEEGEYRKAARLAARILSRLPGSEEALLGRAIALSKAGRQQDVVTELTRHLALRPASDGTLHYVLGLAQLDSGRTAEGQASLREAVRLTPSLKAEVAPRLGKAFSVPQPTTRETNGYA